MQLKGIVLITPNKQVKPIVEEMTYSATSQYQSIKYGNGMQTNYTFDDKSRRISTLITVDNKKLKSGKLQDVAYYYDEIGNIVKLDDKSYQVLFDQPSAQPSASESPTVGSTLTTEINPQADKQLSAQQYEYDSLYRVKTATGRELSSTETAAPPAIPAAAQPTNPAAEITAPLSSILSSASGSAAKILASLQGKDPAKELMPYKESFEYDAGSNLTKQQHQPVTANPASSTPSKAWEKVYQIDEKSNRLKGQVKDNQAEAVDHDSAGNQQNLPGQIKLQWNYLNQLIYAHKKSNEEEIEEYYFYNVAGMRTRKLTKKHLNNVIIITEVIYQGYYELRRQLNVNDLSVIKETETVSLRILDGNRQVATYRYQNNIEGKIIYLLDNHLNSISLEVDEQAEILSYEEYLPYGETSILIGKDQKVIDEKTYHYSGKEKDEATGMYYYGARYYAAGQGRWSATDPAGFVDGLNVYCFVGNNPALFRDTDGRTLITDKLSRLTAYAIVDQGLRFIKGDGSSDLAKFIHSIDKSERVHLEFKSVNYKNDEKVPKDEFGNPTKGAGTDCIELKAGPSDEFILIKYTDIDKYADKIQSKSEFKITVAIDDTNYVKFSTLSTHLWWIDAIGHEVGVHAIPRLLLAMHISEDHSDAANLLKKYQHFIARSSEHYFYARENHAYSYHVSQAMDEGISKLKDISEQKLENLLNEIEIKGKGVLFIKKFGEIK